MRQMVQVVSTAPLGRLLGLHADSPTGANAVEKGNNEELSGGHLSNGLLRPLSMITGQIHFRIVEKQPSDVDSEAFVLRQLGHAARRSVNGPRLLECR